ncbi:MAG: hypothetical protein GVY15_12065 [Bacteroidetes bacterium]|jgi:hypothetical protein|nr:hypothetical protein [Bacteroidota bacterium]
MLQSLFRAVASADARRTARLVKRALFTLVGMGLCLGGLWMLYPMADEVVRTGELPPDAMPTLFIGLIPCFIGGIMLVSAHRESRQHEQYGEALAHEKPWTLREAWQRNEIRHRTRPKPTVLVLGALFLLGGLAGGGFIIQDAIIGADQPEWAALLVLIFPAAGLGMLASAYSAWQKGRRFGTSTLRLDDLPGRLGSRITARVRAHLPADQLPEHGIRVECSCYRRTVHYERSSGDSNSKTKKVAMRLLWRDEHHMRPMSVTSEGVEIPVSFALPEDYPTSTPIRRSDSYLARTGKSDIRWMIEVHAAVPGADYDASFEIPVFAPEEAEHPERDADEVPDSVVEGQPVIPASAFSGGLMDSTATDDPYTEYYVEPDLNGPISKNITLEHLPDAGLRLHVDAQRDSWTPYLVGMGGIVMVAVGIVGLPTGLGLGALVFLLFGGLLLWGAKTMLTHETILTIENGTVTVGTGAGGRKKTTFPVDELKEARVEITGTQNQSHYTIVLQTYGDATEQPGGLAGQVLSDMGSYLGEEHAEKIEDGLQNLRSVVARIDNLHDKQEADWLVEQIHHALDRQPV